MNSIDSHHNNKKKHDYLIVSLLFLINFSNYVDRLIIAGT